MSTEFVKVPLDLLSQAISSLQSLSDGPDDSHGQLIEKLAALPIGAAQERWAMVEIMGFRKHYGRVSEVIQFGAPMICVEVPMGEKGEKFETLYYSGASIFSIRAISEESARHANGYLEPRRLGSTYVDPATRPEASADAPAEDEPSDEEPAF